MRTLFVVFVIYFHILGFSGLYLEMFHKIKSFRPVNIIIYIIRLPFNVTVYVVIRSTAMYPDAGLD